MTNTYEEKVEAVQEFLAYLDRRGLAICNHSQTINAYWPVVASRNELVQAFMKERR